MKRKKGVLLLLGLSVFLVLSSGVTLAQQASLDIDHPDCPTFFNPPSCSFRADWTLKKWTDETSMVHPNQRSFSFEIKAIEKEPKRILYVDGTLVIVNTSEELSTDLTSIVLNLQLEGGGPLPGSDLTTWVTVKRAITNAAELCNQSNVARTCFGDFEGSPGSKLTLSDHSTADPINLSDMPPLPPTEDPACDNALKLDFQGEFDISDTLFDKIENVRFEISVTFNGAGEKGCTTDVNCNGTIDPDDPATEMVNESEEGIGTVRQRETFPAPICADTLCTTAILSDSGAFSWAEDCIEIVSDSLLDTLYTSGIPGTEYDYQLSGTVTCHQKPCTTFIRNATTLQLVDCDVMFSYADSFAVRCTTLVSGINEEEQEKTKKSLILLGNYPNPFNPNTVIEYVLPSDCRVMITIHDILGNRVRTLTDDWQTAGLKKVIWDGKNKKGEKVSSGVYLYKIKAGKFSESKKMVIIK